MDRVTDVFHGSPHRVGQAQGHGRSAAFQRTVNPDPVVEVPPDVQTLLQRIAATRPILGSPSQAGLLTPKRAVEPLDARGVDPRADAQFANPSFDPFDRPGKRLAADFHQVPRVVPNLLDNAHQQARRQFQARIASAAMPATTPTMLDLSEDLKNGGAIWGVVVHQRQRILQNPQTAHGHRRDQRHRRFQRARPHPQIDQKATLHFQGGMSPRATQSTTPRRRPLFSPSFSATRPWSSSIWTASNGSSSRSKDNGWKFLGSRSPSIHDPLDRAGVHLTDVGRRFHRAAVAQALDDPHHGRQGQFAVLQERTLAFAETHPATAAVQTSNGLVLAHVFGDRQSVAAEAVERLAVGIRASEESQQQLTSRRAFV